MKRVTIMNPGLSWVLALRFGAALQRVWILGLPVGCATLLVVAATSLFAADPSLSSALSAALSSTGTISAPVVVASNAPVSPETTSLTPTNSAVDLLTNSLAQMDDKYCLAIGDRVNYNVEEDQEDPKSMVVSDSGDVQVPYLGPFPAQGKTCKELATQIKKQLETKYYYQATVVISLDAMLSRGMIYLVGAVRSPGPLEMPRNDVLTISKAILRAGGFTDFADGKSVRVTRQGQNGTNQVFVMDVTKVLNKGKVEDDKPAQTGDLIFVPERTIRF